MQDIFNCWDGDAGKLLKMKIDPYTAVGETTPDMRLLGSLRPLAVPLETRLSGF